MLPRNDRRFDGAGKEEAWIGSLPIGLVGLQGLLTIYEVLAANLVQICQFQVEFPANYPI